MLRGKNVVITGAFQGIGRETVKVFAENGANVFACSLEKSEEFEQYCKSLGGGSGVEIFPIYFDMLDPTSIKAAVREIQSKKLEIHGLVNIAGMNRDALFSMVTERDMLDTFQVNFFSQISFSQYIVKLMLRKQTRGSIIFTTSSAALDGSEGQLAYASSKAALIGAMRTMAIELGKNGIRVNAVAPGVIKTAMTDRLGESILEERIGLMDIPRIGCAKEVAQLYLFLVSELSGHISGQTIRIDGGMR